MKLPWSKVKVTCWHLCLDISTEQSLRNHFVRLSVTEMPFNISNMSEFKISFIHSIYSLIYSFFLIFVHSFINLLILVYSFIHQTIHSFVCLFIHSFFHLFIFAVILSVKLVIHIFKLSFILNEINNYFTVLIFSWFFDNT